MACMVAIRVVRGLGAEDSRSDDEEERSPMEDVPDDHASSSHITKDHPTNGITNGTNGHADVRRRRGK